jgi:EAL domain-containing protein (putative c-di-GMP-specific phosphodiesterase class I)
MIELEVPDLGTLDAEGPARRSVDQLVAVGVHFAVDDVGTASAASSRLGSVPVSTLKLDRSFVQLLGEDDETAALVAAIVTLTERQGIRVVAEGVETQQQARTLLAQGCRFGQGFLFSPPLLPSDIEQMLRGPEGPSGEQGSLDNGTTEGVSEDT